jgi:S1-C subfamily serine protease
MSGSAKLRWVLLASIVLSFLAACASTGTLENTSSGTLNNTSSTLQINTSDVATGTGFLFSSSDYVITSYHVVHGAKSIRVRLINGERIDATVALKDTNNDIAILKLSQTPTSRQNIITLGDSSSVKTGDRVFTYGFPLVDLLGDAEPRYSEGFINSLSGMSNDPRLFQVSIPIQPGNSGGPVFNEKGELIGIATSSIDADKTKQVFGSIPQNVNFAIKSSYIKSLLPNLPDAFSKR